METTIEELKNSIRTIPNFPKDGIMFKDVTTAFRNPKYFNYSVNSIMDYYKNFGITKVVGIESRGFILGSAIALKLNSGFVLIRKPGKLPYETYSVSYDLEYGTDSLEIHSDALEKDDVVLIHDDVLATGGTINAAIELVRMFGVKQVYANFFVELSFLKGREKVKEDVPVWSLLNF
jgi:adenine phosphoribosyltransferase